jgi:hypothetical protein
VPDIPDEPDVPDVPSVPDPPVLLEVSDGVDVPVVLEPAAPPPE